MNSDGTHPGASLGPVAGSALGENNIHIWRVWLCQTDEALAALRATLSPDELMRADRFYFPEHRARFIAARGALRCILGRYLNLPPERIDFEYNGFGKPSLAADARASNVRFNLSHSRDLALCACARGRELGIDLEAVRPVDNADELAARFFDADEHATYRALPAHRRTEGFFVRWTLKEAYIKAQGQGLSIPLDAFTIPSTPDASGLHFVRSRDPADDARWSATRLAPPPGYVASLVVEGRSWELGYGSWQAP